MNSVLSMRHALVGGLVMLSALAGATGCSVSASTNSNSNSCSADDSVSCTGGASGYSCAAGDSPPDSADPTLVCSVPTTVADADTYCCYTNTITVSSSATCTQDDSVTQSCTGDSFGFSCSGSDTPDQDFSGLTCSNPTPASDGTTSLYCCTN